LFLDARVDTEAEEIERHASHEYLPMDVFVSPVTMREHFQRLSLHAERSRTYGVTAGWPPVLPEDTSLRPGI
jgi:hypothetical protein